MKINKKLVKNYLVLTIGLLGLIMVLILISMGTKAMIWDQMISTTEGMAYIKALKEVNFDMYDDLQRSYVNCYTLLHLIELP